MIFWVLSVFREQLHCSLYLQFHMLLKVNDSPTEKSVYVHYMQ